MNREKSMRLIEIATKLKTVKKELIQKEENGYLGKEVYRVTLNDGSTRICEQITKNKGNGDATIIIPVTPNNELVMIIESRPNTKESVSIAFPAGMVEKGEEQEQSARRELLEETGYIANKLELLEWHYQDAGCSKAIITTFLATNCIKVSEPSLDRDEHLTSMTFTLEEVAELMKKDKINSANSKIAYMTYILSRKKE